MSIRRFFIEKQLPDGTIVNLVKYYDTDTNQLVSFDTSDECNFVVTPDENLDLNCVTFCTASLAQQQAINTCNPDLTLVTGNGDITATIDCCDNATFNLFSSTGSLITSNSTGFFDGLGNNDYTISVICSQGTASKTVTVYFDLS